MQSFIRAGETFFIQIAKELNDMGIHTNGLICDHLCFRVETLAEYEEQKAFLNQNAILLTEAPVNGRPIATFKLQPGFRSKNGVIPLVELPAPKESSPYKTGFEHAEFVITESFEEFQKRHPTHTFKVSGSAINPELCIKTKSGQVKFHHTALEQIIEIEKSLVKKQ